MSPHSTEDVHLPAIIDEDSSMKLSPELNDVHEAESPHSRKPESLPKEPFQVYLNQIAYKNKKVHKPEGPE